MLDQVSPPDWPEPSLFQSYVLESPWALAVALLALAVGLFVAGGRRDQARLQWSSLVPLLAAVGVLAVSYAVETDRERIAGQTRALAEAVADPFDAEAMRSRLTEDVYLLGLGGRDVLMRVAERASERVRIRRYSVMDLRVHVQGARSGRSYIAVWADTEGGQRYPGGWFRTQWLLNWRKEADGEWRLSGVDRVFANGQNVEGELRQMR